MDEAPNIKPIPSAVAIAKGHESFPVNKPTPNTITPIVAIPLPIPPCNWPTTAHKTPAIPVVEAEASATKTKFGKITEAKTARQNK
jgi:hypothetical protein